MNAAIAVIVLLAVYAIFCASAWLAENYNDRKRGIK